MRKGEYERLDDKLDKQTEILMAIKNDIAKEISLLKLAHQKLKYMVIICAVTIGMTLGKPALAQLIPLIL